VTGGSCRCHGDHFETLSEIETGAYTLGEDCQSSTGYLWFTTSSDPICGDESSMALDLAVAQGGDEIAGSLGVGLGVRRLRRLLRHLQSRGCRVVE